MDDKPKPAPKRRLGKGLDALFEVNATDDYSGGVMLRISEIEPNKDQPRINFEQTALEELAESISQHGILSPLLVRPIIGGRYQLVAGERRWRAARMAGLTEVPVIIKELTDTETAEIALIENLQREDLNPIEEALGYKALIDGHGLTQEQVAKRVGKSRPVISNALRLLSLPDDSLKMLENGEITTGHAKVLLSVDDKDTINNYAKEIKKGKLSVRDLEKLVKLEESKNGGNSSPAGDKAKNKSAFLKDSYFKEVEIALNETLGRKVKVSESNGKGTITLDFFDKDDLQDIAKRLAGEQ